ncbi:hypothetical protein R1S95_001416 [Listeria monocytogenes]|nr:hypothetical protein [Listeria monocytogenes]
MKNIAILMSFEIKKVFTSKLLGLYGLFIFSVELIAAIFYKVAGPDMTVITTANAQSIPIQMLQASLTFTALFIALYVGDLYVQDRNNGTIKLVLLRSVTRFQYFITRIFSIFIFTVTLTLITILAGYLVAMPFFGWGESFEFYGVVADGWTGILYTFLGGLAFSYAYFAFGIVTLFISLYIDRVSTLAMIIAGSTIVGQYAVTLPTIKQYIIFQQLLFFHIDCFTQSLTYNLVSLTVISTYILLFGTVGYMLFNKLDLTV